MVVGTIALQEKKDRGIRILSGDNNYTGKDLVKLRSDAKISQTEIGNQLGIGRTGAYTRERESIIPDQWFEEYKNGVRAILDRRRPE